MSKRKTSPEENLFALATIPDILPQNDLFDRPSLHLIKSHQYVHIANKCSHVQKKMVNVLLSNAYENLLTHREHEININDLCRSIDVGTNNVPYVKDLFRNLMSIKFEWNILDTDQPDWTIVSAISRATIRGSTLIYAYDDYLARQLYNPAVYASLDLKIQNRFNSTYAFTLYEQVSRFLTQGMFVTPKIPIAVFKKLMGVEAEHKSLQDFKIFNRQVIKKAMEEINANSDIWIDVEFEKVKRSVTAVQFAFRRKKASEMQISVDIPVVGTTMKDARIENLIVQMAELNVSREDAEAITNLHDDSTILETIDYVKGQHDKGLIKNSRAIGGYFLATIKKRAKVGLSPYEKRKREEQEQAKRTQVNAKEDEQAAEQQVSSAWKDAVVLFDERYASLSQKQQQELLEAFSTSKLPQTVRSAFEKRGIKSTIVKSAFTQYAMPRLLNETELGLVKQAILPKPRLKKIA